MRPKIKICGVTRVEDALRAEALGAEYIGLVFAALSKRKITLPQAREIAAHLTTAKPVGVFVEQDMVETLEIAKGAGLAGIQHYSLLPRKPAPYFYIYARGVRSMVDESLMMNPLPDYVLLDAHVDGQEGGTGQAFDWTLMPERNREKIFMAGGINPENVGRVMAYKPYAIDLSSGVEASPGIKDHQKLEQLFAGVNNAEQL